MQLTLQDIQQRIGGDIVGDPGAAVSGVGSLDSAADGDIVFAEKATYRDKAAHCAARCLVVSDDFPTLPHKSLLRVANPRVAFARIMTLFDTGAISSAPGVHPSAVLAEGVALGSGVAVGPCAVIEPGAAVGRGTVIEAGAYIGRNVVVGEACRIGPRAVLRHNVRLGDRVIIHAGAVLGGDGFGYVWTEGQHLKIPQLGSVLVEDDVEIGCNACIDRATMGVTRIGKGTKLDNLVHIGHNDNIGEHVIMSGQVGIAGSVTVGNRATFAGQSGVVDHVTVGEGAVVYAATPVTHDIRQGEFVWGFPGRPMAKAKRELGALALLPNLVKKLRALAAQVEAIRTRLDSHSS